MRSSLFAGDLAKKIIIIAEYGEWNQKGATLSDVTAKAEYGVDRDFIILNLAIHAAQSSNRHSDASRNPENSDNPLDAGFRRHDGDL